MDPINPWLDADEVRRLAARLLKPLRDPAMPPADAGFGETFVGYAAARPPSPAPPASPPPAFIPPPKPVEPPSNGARGPFLDRIRRLRDWMGQQFAATGLFILDREGAVIFDEGSHGRLHFLARSLALASRRPGGTAGNVHVKIGAAATLEVIPVDTAYGCLVLGVVVPEALPPAAVTAVMDAMIKVAAPPAAVDAPGPTPRD
jgi:hypothetical protein